jgi:plasmid stabilization system protein ParE
MMYRVEISHFAETDIQQSIDWYNEASPGLGTRFYQNVKKTFSLVRKNPQHFPVRYKTIHTALMSKFPFMVHYEVNESEKSLAIVGVIHTSRNPESWDGRSCQ